MADVAPTAPGVEPREQPQRPKLPGLSVGATIGAIAAAVGQAFEMAYVAPYRMDRRHPSASADAEDGRDPTW